MTPKPNKVPAVQIPAAIIYGMVSYVASLISTATMDFMGWTIMGTPKNMHVMMLYTPMNINVVPKSCERNYNGNEGTQVSQ